MTLLIFVGLSLVNPNFINAFAIRIPVSIIFGILINRMFISGVRRSFYIKETESAGKLHAFAQLQKVFYPHQIGLIEQGSQLEDTMPIGKSKAAVICFDVIGSSKLNIERSGPLLVSILKECLEILGRGYDSKQLQGTGYRIKEMGDGFLCSIGFPFQLPENRSSESLAIDVAYEIVSVFKQEVKRADLDLQLYCSMGISSGSIVGYYPKTGVKEYDVYGESVVLATRYQEMRKLIFKDHDGHIMILQTKVYDSLNADQKKDFKRFDLRESQYEVRDDGEAKDFYYRVLD